MVRIVLSGGQTGVDQAALRAAQASCLLCAGWCPPDRSCETGPIPSWFPVQPTPYERSEHRPDVPLLSRLLFSGAESGTAPFPRQWISLQATPLLDTSVHNPIYRLV